MQTNEASTLVIDRNSLEALEPHPGAATWSEDDCMLYAIGVGAGNADPCRELNLTTENSEGVTLQVIPTFGITLCTVGPGLFAPLGVRGQDVLLMEESIRLARPIRPTGSAKSTGRVVAVADHPRGYVVTVENEVVDGADHGPMFTTRSRTLVHVARPDSEIAAMRKPPVGSAVPSRAPDASVAFSIAQNQCLLYRLASGRNPLHSDPTVSRRVGYQVPLLHGRCTLGFAARHLIDEVCSGDASKLRALSGKLSAPVFPGDDLTTRIWREADKGSYEILRPRDGVTVVSKGTFECAV
ncbi:acyl dehydratase [Antricoccus suffuscus]|uniref:Acyl dehydratase n=1 Tax=Antricoccus suffuscus TaxID=1629062 RepID=A0A2T0ZWX6_9ACTN|nr:MaoC/PaaZ C-terminal domain-containing protein [Antricoccus suffuscus]PRZ40851.1 acyl dehydratase [Antricoccus suffuscus]